MNKLIGKIVAHKLNDLEPLLEMQTLLICRNVNTLCEVIRSVAINGCGDITCGIKRRTVRFKNKARRHIVFRKIDDRRTVVYFKQTLFAEKIYLLLHFIGIERFSRIAVKIYTESFIRLVAFVKRYFYKPFPQFRVFGIALFKLCKLGACTVIQSGILFGFLVESDIKADELVNAEFFNSLSVAPEFVCRYLLAELSSPISEMIYAYAVVSAELMKLFKRMTYNGRSKMSYMKRLADIRCGIVKHYGLSLADVALAVIAFFGKYLRNKSLCIISA